MAKDRVTVSLDADVAAKLRNEDNTSEVARRVFRAWYENGEREAAFIKDRINEIRAERERLQEREAELRKEQKEKEARLEDITPDREAVIEAAEPILDGVENPENPAAMNWAEKAGMSPGQLLKAVNGNGDSP